MARQTSEKTKVKLSSEQRYLVYLPKEYKSGAKKKWPLVLFLHGSGERGNNLHKLNRHGPPKLIEAGREFPFVIVSPQCAAGAHWNTFALEGLIEHVAQTYRVDRSRIYLTGLSMGGYGVWDLAMSNPGKYAAVIPICGGGVTLYAGNLRKLPVWAFHGGKDRVVPPRRSREMIDAIKSAGGKPRFTIYPRLAHDSWTVTYEDPEIYEWLLSHRRGESAKRK